MSECVSDFAIARHATKWIDKKKIDRMIFIETPEYHSQTANQNGFTFILFVFVFRFCYQSIKFCSIEFICCIIIDTIYGFYSCTISVLSCSPRASLTNSERKTTTEHFVHGRSKELMNILSLTLWKRAITGEQKE